MCVCVCVCACMGVWVCVCVCVGCDSVTFSVTAPLFLYDWSFPDN